MKNACQDTLFYFCLTIMLFGSISTQARLREYCTRNQKIEYSKYKSYLDTQKPYAREITNNLISKFEENGADVVLLANVGLNVSDKKFSHPNSFFDTNSHKYMHTGLAYKDPNDGQWKIYHLLNEYDSCRNETTKSYVSNDKLRTFFTHPHYKMDILMSIPSKDLQKKILNIIKSENSLHNPNYSAIANPESLKKQNSNQFILNILATAQSDSKECQEAFNNNKNKIHNSPYPDILKAQLCYKAKSFEPSIIIPNLHEPMGITLAKEFGLFPKISLDDHSYQSQISHQFPFVSAASLFSYLKKTDPQSSQPQEVCPSSACNLTKDDILERYITKSNQGMDQDSNAQTK